MITTLPTTDAHAIAVAARMRKADADEIAALGFASPLDALRESLSLSTAAITAFVDGEPVGIVGIAVPHLIGEVAAPWLVTTDVVDRHPLAFARASRRILPLLIAGFSSAENWVDARYTSCIEWLRWLGFTVDAAQPVPPLGMLFCRFSIKGEA